MLMSSLELRLQNLCIGKVEASWAEIRAGIRTDGLEDGQAEFPGTLDVEGGRDASALIRTLRPWQPC